jgi:ribonuclease Z
MGRIGSSGPDVPDPPTTTATLTGTGVPAPLDARRAGPGVLIQHSDLALQFDAGRATSLRLAALGLACTDLTAVFVTHHHSDHLIGLDDLVMTRWFDDPGPTGELPVVAPNGACVRFVERMLDRWDDDIAVRQANEMQATRPTALLRAFEVSEHPTEVWRESEVTVQAAAVHHEPVVPAVAYRVNTPAGDVVISGDTRICSEVETLASGAHVLVHEALARTLLPDDPAWDPIVDYHAETQELGALAARLDVPVLMLTHLCPPAMSLTEEQIYADGVRTGGFGGQLIVGRDLDAVVLSASGVRVRRARMEECAAGSA